jgi:hypothetical protein
MTYEIVTPLDPFTKKPIPEYILDLFFLWRRYIWIQKKRMDSIKNFRRINNNRYIDRVYGSNRFRLMSMTGMDLPDREVIFQFQSYFEPGRSHSIGEDSIIAYYSERQPFIPEIDDFSAEYERVLRVLRVLRNSQFMGLGRVISPQNSSFIPEIDDPIDFD